VIGSKPKLCVFCGRMDDSDHHRDEDNFVRRCPEADGLERFGDVQLRVLSS